MKVLFFDHTSELGGAEIMLEAMAVGLQQRGHQVKVVVGGNGPLVFRLRTAGVEVETVELGRLQRSGRKALPQDVRASFDLRRVIVHLGRVIEEFRAEVVFSNSQKAHVLTALACRRSGAPLVWRMHDILSGQTFGWMQLTALRWARSLARPLVLAVSEAAAQAARQHLPGAEVRRVHNGRDLGALIPKMPRDLRRELDWPRDAVVFLLLGRLVPWKGPDHLIEAAVEVVRAWPGARFLIVGDEVMSESPGFGASLRAKVFDAGLAEFVSFQSFTDDVGAVLADADVLVQPSVEADPFPTTVLEAALLGVPVVAYRHGGVPEVVIHGSNGLLVEPGDVAGLARACARIAADSSLRNDLRRGMAAAGRQFNEETMLQELEAQLSRMALSSPWSG